MTQPNSVPQLNLAPQLNRSLSLWNPFDYLRFLYWIFFFPQALRWYEEEYLIDNKSNQIKLWIQGLLLTAVIPISICKFLEEIGYSINWSGVYFGIVLGVITVVIVQRLIQQLMRYECEPLWVVYIVAWIIIFSELLSIAYGILPPLGLNGFFTTWLGLGIFLCFILQVWFCWGLGLVPNLALSMSIFIDGLKNTVLAVLLLFIFSLITKKYDITYAIALLMIYIVISHVWLYGKSIMKFAVVYSLIIGVVLYSLLKLIQNDYGEIVLGNKSQYIFLIKLFILADIGLFIIIFRPENWLIGSLLNRYKIQNNSFLFPRITPIPLPFLTSRLTTWLRQDWLLGLHNTNELLRYSHQFIPVVKAVNKVLHETPPEHLVFRVSQLAMNPADWQLIRYASASLSEALQTNGVTRDPRLDTPPRATAAGFWYLHEQESQKAMEAFDVVRTFPYGEEMFILSQTLDQLQQAAGYSKFNFILDNYINISEAKKQAKTLKKLQNIAAVKLPTFPSEPLLRPTTWEVLNSLRSVIIDIRFIVGEISQSTSNAALNRAINKLQIIIENSNTIPEAERTLIVGLTQDLKETLEEIK
ncbi:MAG: hypothetical protein WBA13_20550 [Microcoleaceae cyanobacterium]